MKKMLLAAFVAFATPALATGGMVLKKNMGAWDLEVHESDVEGHFCYVSTIYEPRTNAAQRRMRARWMEFTWAVSTNENTGYFFKAGDWDLTKDDTYEVKIHFVGYRNTPWNVPMVAVEDTMLGFKEPLDNRFVEDFMHSEAYKLWVRGKYLGRFALNGSGKAILECLKIVSAYQSTEGTF